MYKKIIADTEYDFDRCTFEQLRQYAASSLEWFINMGEDAGPLGPLGTKLEADARVPERKSDVVEEIVAEVASHANRLLELSGRYGKAE